MEKIISLLIVIVALTLTACGDSATSYYEEEQNCFFPAGESIVDFTLLATDCPKGFDTFNEQSGTYMVNETYKCGFTHEENVEDYNNCVKEQEVNTVIKSRVMEIDYNYNYCCPTFKCSAKYHQLITSKEPDSQLH